MDKPHGPGLVLLPLGPQQIFLRSVLLHMLPELTVRISRHNSPKVRKVPLRPLKLPSVVAAHERRRSTMFMNAMTNRALYAQTIEGHTPALTERPVDDAPRLHPSGPITNPEVTPRRGLWRSFCSWLFSIVSAVQLFIQPALSVFTHSWRSQARGAATVPPNTGLDTTISYADKVFTSPDAGSIPSKYRNDSEELAIWQALEYEQPDPSKRPYYRVQLYEEAYPNISGTDQIHIQRHKNLVELSPQSVVSASWTVAVRDAHTRKGPVSVDALQHPPDAHFYP